VIVARFEFRRAARFSSLLPKRDSHESVVCYLPGRRTDRAISWFVTIGSQGVTE
jgi:hypothetical protein